MEQPLQAYRGPTGFGRDIIFGPMGRSTEPMHANISITNNRRNRSMGGSAKKRIFDRARHTEGGSFWDTLLNIGKKIIPVVGSFLTGGPVAGITSAINAIGSLGDEGDNASPEFSKQVTELAKVGPQIVENAANNPQLSPLVRKLLELTKDPEMRQLLEELLDDF